MDDICWTICSLLICTVALLAVEAGSESMPVDKYAPKPGSRKSLDKHTDKTIDQLITEALGGIDVASNKILAPGENILAELDMYLSQDQFLNLYSPPSNIVMRPAQNASRLTVPRHKRKAVRDVILRWPRAEIPYQFAKGHFSAKEEYLMKQSMTEWERYTCIKFRPANSADRNILRFQNGEGCNSQLGMVGGVQLLNLDVAGCRYRGLYLHEIGHAIGLVHEHQLPDRDDYIEILYQNVAPQMRVWFNKYSTNMVNQFSVPYEYSSVMHYGITAFSFDGQSQTIRTKDPAKEESVGKVYLKELSFSDIKVASIMYGCSAPCLNPVTCGDGGFLDQNCQCVCPDGSQDCEVSKDNKEVSTDTSGGTDESCINRYDNWKCSIWANYGECERNPLYMETYCTKACGMCGKSKEKEDKNHFTTWAWQWFGMFANLFPKDWMIGVCKDVYSYEKCSKWKELGDCVTNSKWMGKNCRMTCNQCGNPALKPETSCQNRHSDNTKCDQWALDGECILNSKWMLENCKKSCHACADGTDTHGKDEDKTKDKEEEDDSRCEDKHNTKDCQGWAKVGECSSNPSWMIPNCKKSCAKCDDGICKNLYDDTQCKIWAEDLECMANRIWMHKYCAVSCGVCTSNTTNTGTGSGTGTTTRHPELTKRPSVTTTKRPGRERCSNLHNDVECDMWAKTGHCDINPSWMYGNCRKACRVCDGTTGNEDTGTTEVCRDREVNRCPGWAKYGFCDSNPGYNLIYCKKSCNNCNGCRDEQFLCGVWAKAGHCTTNAGYMLRYCQRSCKTCE